jgi:DNA-binding response OmpR family regulator
MADYPAHLARQRRLADGRAVTIRPIRAEDEAAEQLRSKLETDPTDPKHLVTVRGVGYRFKP